jgi:tripartite-type tricarboxylate transporter receptor subunit TctC
MKARHLFFFVVLCMLGFSTLAPSASFAQRYPDHPIQLVIATSPGANMDIMARILVDELGKIIGVKILPNNKPGASMVLGTDAVVRAKKDGYTLLYSGSSAVIYAPIISPEDVQYDPSKDLELLGFHYFNPHTITVRSDSPWKTFSELIDYAKKNPGKLRVSTTGIGSPAHFMLEVIQVLTGTQFIHVPFKSGESVTTALLGGHVEVTCDGFAKLQPHADAGKLRMLLITSKLPAFPGIPTITELGYKQNIPTAWYGIYGPAGIPEEVKKILVPAIEKAIKNTKPKIDQTGNLCEYKSPSEFRKLWEEDYKQVYEIAVRLGLHKP